MSKCSGIIYWKSYLSPSELLYHLCKKWVGCTCVGLFLSSPLCFVDLCVCTSASATVLLTIAIYSNFWNWIKWFFQFIFHIKIISAILISFPYTFYDIVVCTKNLVRILIEIINILYICINLGRIDIFAILNLPVWLLYMIY